jgi:hypothetical protein
VFVSFPASERNPAQTFIYIRYLDKVVGVKSYRVGSGRFFVCEVIRHTSIKYLEPSCDWLYDVQQHRNFSLSSFVTGYYRVFYVTLTIDKHYYACVNLTEYFFMLDREYVLFQVEAELLETSPTNVTPQSVKSLFLKTKRNPLYTCISNQSVPRSKHFPP